MFFSGLKSIRFNGPKTFLLDSSTSGDDIHASNGGKLQWKSLSVTVAMYPYWNKKGNRSREEQIVLVTFT